MVFMLLSVLAAGFAQTMPFVDLAHPGSSGDRPHPDIRTRISRKCAHFLWMQFRELHRLTGTCGFRPCGFQTVHG